MGRLPVNGSVGGRREGREKRRERERVREREREGGGGGREGTERLVEGENTRREGRIRIRERENAGAATPCKRKIYKLESPIKSVPAVTTSPPSFFHVERRLFVSCFSSSRSPARFLFPRQRAGRPRIWTSSQESAETG